MGGATFQIITIYFHQPTSHMSRHHHRCAVTMQQPSRCLVHVMLDPRTTLHCVLTRMDLCWFIHTQLDQVCLHSVASRCSHIDLVRKQRRSRSDDEHCEVDTSQHTARSITRSTESHTTSHSYVQDRMHTCSIAYIRAASHAYVQHRIHTYMQHLIHSCSIAYIHTCSIANLRATSRVASRLESRAASHAV